MTIPAFSHKPQSLKREQLEHATRQWSELLCRARTLLVEEQWQAAVMQYWYSYELAQQLLQESLCQQCATKGYIRTLTELAYALRKNQQSEKLQAIMELAKPLWQRQLSLVLTQELIAILTNITYAPIAQIDTWIDGLFAMDAAVNQPLH